MKKNYLLIIDTPSVKKYVFGTDKLKEIRGASAILDYLNRDLTERWLKDTIGATKVKRIYANGGSGQFILQGVSEDDVVECGESLKKLYADGTKESGHILYGYSPIDGDYKNARELANFNLIREKEKGHTVHTCHTPYSKDCDSCSGNSASNALIENGEKIWLCQVCYNKRNPEKNPLFGNENIQLRVWTEFGRYLKKEGLTDKKWFELRPPDFESIGDDKGYIGLVYADGNGMGRLIKQIDTHERLTLFSKTCDEVIREACFETLAKLFPDERELLPVDILLLGGDDLVVVMKADKVFEFAIEVTKKFTEKTRTRFEQANDSFFKDRLNNKGLTISLGIAIGKHSHPFRVLLDQAEGLLSLSKKKGSKDGNGLWSPSFMDFHIGTHSHQLDIETIRETEYQIEKGSKTSYITMRPYEVDKLEELFQFAKTFKRESFPRTKLQQLYPAPFLGRENGMLRCIEVYSRCKKEERQLLMEAFNTFNCWDKMPWKDEEDKAATMLTDLIDILEFTDET